MPVMRGRFGTSCVPRWGAAGCAPAGPGVRADANCSSAPTAKKIAARMRMTLGNPFITGEFISGPDDSHSVARPLLAVRVDQAAQKSAQARVPVLRMRMRAGVGRTARFFARLEFHEFDARLIGIVQV